MTDEEKSAIRDIEHRLWVEFEKLRDQFRSEIRRVRGIAAATPSRAAGDLATEVHTTPAAGALPCDCAMCAAEHGE